MNKKIIIIICAFFLGVSSSLFSQADDPVFVSSAVDSARIRIGDLIHYSVTVIHDDSVKVQMPGFAANLGGFEIRDYNIEDPKKKDGKTIIEASYTISTFITGVFEIPPFAVRYTLGRDSIQHVIMTDKIQIVVESMKASEAGDIRDVKIPLEIKRDWWYTLKWVVAGLAAAIIIMAGIILYRRWKSGKPLLPVREIPPRPAHEVALEALDQLMASELAAHTALWITQAAQNPDLLRTEPWKKEQAVEIKHFYSELSEIIRQYINGRYFVVALEMTTSEVLEGLDEQNLEVEIFDLFKVFLEDCDLVKFAKFIPPEALHQTNVRLAYDIVEKTKIVFQSEVVPEITDVPETHEKIPENSNTDEAPETALVENNEVDA